MPRAVSDAAPPRLVTLAPSVAVVCAMDVAVGEVTVGSVTIVWVPPAPVEPDLLPAAKVRSPVAMALTLIVRPAVGEAAMSAVMKK